MAFNLPPELELTEQERTKAIAQGILEKAERLGLLDELVEAVKAGRE